MKVRSLKEDRLQTRWPAHTDGCTQRASSLPNDRRQSFGPFKRGNTLLPWGGERAQSACSRSKQESLQRWPDSSGKQKLSMYMKVGLQG